MKEILLGIIIVLALTGIYSAADKTTSTEVEQIEKIGRYQLVVGGESRSTLFRIDTATGAVDFCERELFGEYTKWKKIK